MDITPTQVAYALASSVLSSDVGALGVLLDLHAGEDVSGRGATLDPDGVYDPDLYPAVAVVRAAVVAVELETRGVPGALHIATGLSASRAGAVEVLKAAGRLRSAGPIHADELLVSAVEDHGPRWLVVGAAHALAAALSTTQGPAATDVARRRCAVMAGRV